MNPARRRGLCHEWKCERLRGPRRSRSSRRGQGRGAFLVGWRLGEANFRAYPSTKRRKNVRHNATFVILHIPSLKVTEIQQERAERRDIWREKELADKGQNELFSHEFVWRSSTHEKAIAFLILFKLFRHAQSQLTAAFFIRHDTSPAFESSAAIEKDDGDISFYDVEENDRSEGEYLEEEDDSHVFFVVDATIAPEPMETGEVCAFC